MQIQIPEKVIERAIQQQYFNKTESASFLGVSITTFKKWAVNIKPIVVDGQILYAKDDLVEFMDGHRKQEKT